MKLLFEEKKKKEEREYSDIFSESPRGGGSGGIRGRGSGTLGQNRGRGGRGGIRGRGADTLAQNRVGRGAKRG